MTAALRQAHWAVEQLVLQLHLILVKLTKLWAEVALYNVTFLRGTVLGKNNGGEKFVCYCSTYGIILISLILLKNATESIVHVSAV